MSEAKYIQLQSEVVRLEEYREQVLVRLQAAREQGDLSENGAYTSAKFELRTTDRRLRNTKSQLFRAHLVSASSDVSTASLYHRVAVKEGDSILEFELVGDTEADPSQHKVSTTSPIGKALMGSKVGQLISLTTPQGLRQMHVIEIKTSSL